MRENNKYNTELKKTTDKSHTNYFDDANLNYYGFQLSSLAKKIKSECLKFKKLESHLIIP